MLILIISVLISNVSAKLSFFPDFYENGIDELDSKVIQPVVNRKLNYFNGDPLWVLILSNDEWISPKLRLGNTAEMEDFFTYIAPLIEAARRREAANPTSKIPEKTTKSNKPDEVKSQKSMTNINKEFLHMVNKYVLSTKVPPDSYLRDRFYAGSPYIAVYFKGPHTSLAVKLGKKQWHYFIDTQSFSDWFYKTHDTRDSPITLPEDVKTSVLNTLIHFFEIMFGHTI